MTDIPSIGSLHWFPPFWHHDDHLHQGNQNLHRGLGRWGLPRQGEDVFFDKNEAKRRFGILVDGGSSDQLDLGVFVYIYIIYS